jgi:S1-C subfamily serine protease
MCGRCGKESRLVASLAETFEAVHCSVVGFASTVKIEQPGREPILPSILGTGFVIDERGIIATNRHVVEAVLGLPLDPRSGKLAATALVTTGVKEETGGYSMPMLCIGIKGMAALTSFNSNAPYYGEPLPDMAFVQLDAKGLLPLQLATAENSWRTGMEVAIAGFPLGTKPLEIFEKVTQIMPFLKHGIISSVFPFPCPFPHGFSTDILTQGGNSGSPVFRTDSPIVLGMHEAVVAGAGNITLAVPSNLIALAFDRYLEEFRPEFDGVPTIQDLLTNRPATNKPIWTRLDNPPKASLG